MVEKKDQSTGMNLGELTTIRNILMGQQMNEYDQRFGEIEDLITSAEERLNKRISDLEERSNYQIETLQAKMSERIEKLENLLTENVSNINQKIETISVKDKHE
jgi:uncharacterized coiled-coil protein SlyX